jgi:hypothetical protein
MILLLLLARLTADITDNLTKDQNEVSCLYSNMFILPLIDQIKMLNDMFTILESIIKNWNKVQIFESALE